MSLAQQIEAILFYKNEPVAVADLAKLLGVSKTEILSALEDLKNSLVGRGIVLFSNGEEYSLATAPELSGLIERMTREELDKNLTSAALEVLAIVAYRGPVSRKEIEYIRGVNSSFSLRTLLIRGLIEREASRLDERIFLYKASGDFIKYVGVTSLTELPEYETVRKETNEV